MQPAAPKNVSPRQPCLDWQVTWRVPQAAYAVLSIWHKQLQLDEGMRLWVNCLFRLQTLRRAVSPRFHASMNTLSSELAHTRDRREGIPYKVCGSTPSGLSLSIREQQHIPSS